MIKKVQTQKLVFVLVVAASAVVVLTGQYLATQNRSQTAAKPELTTIQTGTNEIQITGTITEVDDSCTHDGVCRVKIAEYWVTTNLGGDPTPEMAANRGPKGSIFGPDGSATNTVSTTLVGMQAEVFAQVTSDSSLSLYGKPEYYLKINASTP